MFPRLACSEQPIMKPRALLSARRARRHFFCSIAAPQHLSEPLPPESRISRRCKLSQAD
jgi:hypothetical protein